MYVTFPGGTLIVTTTTNNNPDKKAFTLIEAVAPNASFDTNTMHVELSDRFPPQSASFSFKVFKNSKQNLFLEYRGAVIAFCTWIIFQKIFGNTKSLTNTIDTVFLEKIVPQNLRNAVRQTLEAIFINQFNFWAQQATLKNNNTSLVEYLKGDSAGREVARLKTTIGDLYAEYLYLTADVTFTAQTNLLAVFPRHTYAQQILPWQNAYEQTNWSDFGLTIEFKNDFRKWDLGRALEAYDQHSKLYHPYMPLGDLSAFDKNFITSGKNLFVTLLNSNKIRTYPSFFDINLEKLNPLAEEAPLGFDNL